ncbi:MAG: hypothetical protein ACR2HF_03100 [Methylococcaceae bacterium]
MAEVQAWVPAMTALGMPVSVPIISAISDWPGIPISSNPRVVINVVAALLFLFLGCYVILTSLINDIQHFAPSLLAKAKTDPAQFAIGAAMLITLPEKVLLNAC